MYSEKTIGDCCPFDYFNRYPCEGVQDCYNCNRFICCDCINPEKYQLMYSGVTGMAREIAALRSQLKDAKEVIEAGRDVSMAQCDSELAYLITVFDEKDNAYRAKYGGEE